MDSEVTNLAQVKAFDSADYATAAQGTTADNALPKTGGAMTGAITTNSTFDGRDVATDGTKLDGIEASADVTDTANVTAAGALMDSELTSEASVKALNQGVATTDTPTFAGVTANGTVEFDGLSGTGAVTVTDILDQDNMSSNSATALATQQSIKAYVDSQVGTVDTLAEVLANGNATGGTDVAFGDNDKALFGAGSDLQIYHDGSHSRIADRGTGDLRLYGDSLQLNSWTSANNYLTAATDGAVTIYHNGSEKLATTATGIDVTGNVSLPDNGKAIFGASSDLQIYHDGTHSYVSDVGTGNLILKGTHLNLRDANNALYMEALQGGAVTLRHAGNVSLSTTSTGIDVTGNMESDSVTIGVGAVAGTEKLRVNGTVLTLGGTAATPAIGIGDTNTGVYAPSAGQLGWTVNGTQRLFLDSTGIDVTGTVTVDGLTVGNSVAPIVTLEETGVGTFYHVVDSNAFSIRNNSLAVNSLKINSNNSVQFFEDTGTTAKFHWDAATESLGIGTSSPSQKLSVADGAHITGANATAADSSGSYTLAVGANAGSKSAIFAGDVITSGSVGIGTDSPNQLLSINSTIAGERGISFDQSGVERVKLLYTNSSGAFTINNTTAGYTSFENNGSEAMRIDSSGNLLVGRTSASGVDTDGHVLFANGVSYQSNTDNAAQFVNRNGIDGSITSFYKNGTTVGSIGSIASDLFIAEGNVGLRFDGENNQILPCSTTASTDGTCNLGATSARFKDLYLSGTAYSGNLLVGRTSNFSGAKAEIQTSDNVTTLTLNKNNTNDGEILRFAKSGSTVGSITTDSGYLAIGKGDTGLLFQDGGDAIQPRSISGTANRDGAIDLGVAGGRFKDLYLSGGAYLGGVAAANKLDDYEEGTFTPVMTGVSGWDSSEVGHYTKVGNLVTVMIYFSSNSALTGTPVNTITGLPFSNDVSERASNVSVSRMFGIDLTTTDYIAGVSSTEIVFSFVNGDNNTNNFTHSGSTLRFTVSATYFTA